MHAVRSPLPAPAPPADPVWLEGLARAQQGIVAVVVLLNVLFPLVLFASGWPRPWRVFDGESSPINWFSSVQCAILGAWAVAVWLITSLGRTAGSDPIGRAWPWLVVAAGFFFTSADEYFEIHERTRDEFLKPAGWFTEIPGVKSGDVVLPLYAVAGAVLTLVLVRDLARHRSSLVKFVSALGLIAVAAGQDSLSLRILKIPWVRHTQIVAEETAEVWAQALFALALIGFFFFKLRAFLAAVASGARGRS